MSGQILSKKGQVTLRKDLQQHLGVAPGERIDFDKMPNGTVQIRPARGKGKFADVFGMLHRPGERARTIEEINEAIADGWAGIDR